MLAKIQKWGNSQGLRFPRRLLEEAGVGVGDEVDVVVQNGRIVVSASERVRGKYRLEDLVEAMPAGYEGTEDATSRLSLRVTLRSPSILGFTRLCRYGDLYLPACRLLLWFAGPVSLERTDSGFSNRERGHYFRLTATPGVIEDGSHRPGLARDGGQV